MRLRWTRRVCSGIVESFSKCTIHIPESYYFVEFGLIMLNQGVHETVRSHAARRLEPDAR